MFCARDKCKDCDKVPGTSQTRCKICSPWVTSEKMLLVEYVKWNARRSEIFYGIASNDPLQHNLVSRITFRMVGSSSVLWKTMPIPRTWQTSADCYDNYPITPWHCTIMMVHHSNILFAMILKFSLVAKTEHTSIRVRHPEMRQWLGKALIKS